MFWSKKRKPPDFSTFDASRLSNTGPDFSAVPGGGPLMKLPFELIETDAPPIDREAAWVRLGARVWDLLKRKRMAEIWPQQPPSEFARYLELLQRTRAEHPEYAAEIFIGLRHPQYEPMFVPRFIFQRHAYILGGSGSGKTSSALPTLLLQLATPHDWTVPGRLDKAPILIIDMKQNGDDFLREFAQEVARAEGRRFRMFSTDPDFESHIFDPLRALRTIRYPLKLLETLLNAFSLIYKEGYGSDFFTNEQRVQLLQILYDQRPQTLDELIRFVASATSGSSGNKDARGLYSAMAELQYAVHLNTDGSPVDPDRMIDLDRFYDEGEILYVHLDSRGTYLLGREIGKLLLFSLLETASQRRKRRQHKQAFVFMDEFHRLAARNIIEMLEDARTAGVGFMLSHQTPESLKTRDADLFGILYENCSFRQCLSLSDPRLQELFKSISGRIVERRYGHSDSTSVGRASGSGWSTSQSSSQSNSSTTGAVQTSSRSSSGSPSGGGWNSGSSYSKSKSSTTGDVESRSSSRSGSEERSSGRSQTDSWREEMVPGLTPEMIQQVEHVDLLSLVHVKGIGDHSLTPTGGRPLLVQGLHLYTWGEYHEILQRPLPLRTPMDTEEFYRKARPTVPTSAVDAVAAAAGGSGGSPSAGPRRQYDKPRNEAEQREFQSRIEAFVQPLASQMIQEPLSVETFARHNGLPVERVLSAGNAVGLELAAKESLIKARDVERLKRELGLADAK